MKISLLKTITSLCILIFSLSGICLFSQEARVRVTKENAILRVQPRSDSSEILKLPLGAVLEVEETIGEWIKIKLPPNEQGLVVKGYILTSFVEIEVKRTAQETDKPKTLEPPTKPASAIDTSSSDFNDWQKKMNLAKSRNKTGDTISWVGLGFGVVGNLLYWIDLKPETSYSSGYYTTTTTTTYKHKGEYLLVGIGGVIMSLVGYGISNPAKDEIKLLELEGAKKGYIKANIGPTNNGIYFNLTLVF